jgi:hypothetical protein
MLILVEGIDKSGKSTFINKFASTFGCAIYRKPIPIEIAPMGHHEYFKGVGYAILGLHSCLDLSLLVDRSFISDFVYSNRRSSGPSLNAWHAWEKECTRENVLLVYVWIDRTTQIERLTRGRDPFTDVGDYSVDVANYETYLKLTRFRVARIGGNASFADQLSALHRMMQDTPALASDPFTGVVAQYLS